MIRITFLIVGLLFILSVSTYVNIEPVEQAPFSPSAKAEKLVIFLQAQDDHFRTNTIPKLEKWCQKENIELMVQNASEGTPNEITATPAIIYANNQGHSVYSSRYMEWNTIRNFVRTNRLRPRAEVPFCTNEILQMQKGRAQLIAPIKLTALQGAIPAGFSESQFRGSALSAISEGMHAFQKKDSVQLSKTDRIFYCDAHPYIDESGMLFVSLEVYSMFNCIRPIYSTGDAPIQASMRNQDDLFYKVGQHLEHAIQETITKSEEGDRWSPLPDNTAFTEWENFGLTMPIIEQSEAISSDFTLEQNWSQPTAIVKGVPSLFFNFLPPLDRYAGEVPDFKGNLSLHPNGSIANGHFIAHLKSMTMGMKELDDKVKKKYIFTKQFPDASFRFQTTTEGLPLNPGIINRVPISGTFEFMEKEIPLTVQAEFTPQLDEQQQQQLMVHVNFQVNITDDFQVKGPDGPEDASKNMAFDLNFILSPDNH